MGGILMGDRNDTPKPLNDRQLAVLRLAAQGLTNAEIARRLHISEKYTARMLSNDNSTGCSIFFCIQVTRRSQATSWYISRYGFPSDEQVVEEYHANEVLTHPYLIEHLSEFLAFAAQTRRQGNP